MSSATDKDIANKITINNLKRKMVENNFDSALIEALVSVFEKRINKNGEKAFQQWIYNLNFNVPEEFQNQERAIKVYQRSSVWFEEEIIKLEKETELPWEIQAEDLINPDERVRKTQLVIRHRLTELTMDLLD